MIKNIINNKIFNGKPTDSVAGAAVIIAVAGIASRLLGLFRDRILAAEFGAGETLDVYYAAFRIPDLLPVMDHRNQAIEMPDSFAVNTAMQGCLAKAIALHGIGLYIHAGEDIPPDSSPFQTLGMQEVEVVTRLSQQANIEPQVICSTYNVDKVEDIPLIKFAEIVDRLQSKIKTAAKG